MPLQVRREHDIVGKTYMVGDSEASSCIVIFFTWAVNPQPGSIPISVSSVSKPYFALLKVIRGKGVDNSWYTVALLEDPKAAWSEEEWQALAVKAVEDYLVTYTGPRPNRFEREPVI